MNNLSIDELFTTSKGQPILYKGKELRMMDQLPLPARSSSVKISFLSTDSSWRQGIVLQTKGTFEIVGILNQSFLNRLVLWEDTAPKEVQLLVHSTDKTLVVYNAWDTGDGTLHYWHNQACMYIEEQQAYRVYHCNEGLADDDLNDLVFKLEFLPPLYSAIV